MKALQVIITLSGLVALGGCAGVYFNDQYRENAVEYRSTVPVVLVTIDGDCKVSSQIASVPGRKRYISFRSGLGKSVSSFEFNPGGTISKVGVTTEGQVKDALDIGTAARGLFGLAESTSGGGGCKPKTAAYEIRTDAQGQVTIDKSMPLFVIP